MYQITKFFFLKKIQAKYSLVCASRMPLSENMSIREYALDRDICTGLGDRLGVLLTLAALAHLENVSVSMRWCLEPTANVISRIKPHIPHWRGYDFSLQEFQQAFRLPSNVLLTDNTTKPVMAKVQWENVGVPAEHGLDAVYTIAWRTMRLSMFHTHAHDFITSYKTISSRLLLKTAQQYAVLHLRGPDANTPDAYDHDASHFCTPWLLRRLSSMNVPVRAISNNRRWANELLNGYLVVSDDASPIDDMKLIGNAVAIIQHVWGSWSSFSTVPALAMSIPIITTFRGTPSRIELLRHYAAIPSEMYTCSNKHAFLNAVREKLESF